MKKQSYIFSFLFLIMPWIVILAEQPRAEYPRPQFKRDSWINLNGEWSYTFDFTQTGEEKSYFKSIGFQDKIIVPFAPESELSGVGFKDFVNCIWYHRKLEIPAKWYDKKLLLHFGAIYYESEIYIDGQLVNRHFGGSSSFSIDITSYVKAGSQHDLVVKASSNLRNSKQSAGKQATRFASWGCSYTRTSGIWQTVWLEAMHPQAISGVRIYTDIDQKQLIIYPRFYSEKNHLLEVKVKDGTNIIVCKKVEASNSGVLVLPIKNPRLWSPESPFLYDLEFTLYNRNGAVIDKVISYTGMRKVHIEGNKIYLNNQPYYQRLVLDQGFYPDGIWTAPNDKALQQDILLSKEAGFNGARLHQKVFEERFYYWADKLGYLTWGEAPSWGMDCNNVETARNFLSEWGEIMTRDVNHPSIIIWTPMNESWWPDQIQYARFVIDLYNQTKALDPTRPVNTVSGGVHIKTDIWTVHNYEQVGDSLKRKLFHDGIFQETPNEMIRKANMNLGFNDPLTPREYPFPMYDGKKPYILDEFGGIKWAPKATQDSSWGYGNAPKTEEEFYQRLESQIDAVLSLKDQVWGYCYTQLTDVEQEQNGIYFYDRTFKFDMKRIYRIFSKEPQVQIPTEK